MEFDYTLFPVPPADVCIDLKVGFPAPDMLPLDEMRICTQEKLSENNPNLLNYGKVEGYEGFRKSLAEFLAPRYGVEVDHNSLFISHGTSSGISLMATYFTRPGDTILIERPTYFIARSTFTEFGLNVVEVPQGSDGAAIDRIIREELNGVCPKFFYCIPVAHNPTGRTLTLEQKKDIAAVAKKWGFFVLADEVYQLLSFPKLGKAFPPPMFSIDPEVCVSLSSFSKIFCPSIRLGWIQANDKFLNHLKTRNGILSGGGMNLFVSGIVHRAILNGCLEAFLEKTRLELQSRCEHTITCIEKEIGNDLVHWEIPSGGYFIILRVKNSLGHDTKLCTKELLNFARQVGVSFLPGIDFGGEEWQDWLRISFSYYKKEELEMAIKKLKIAIHKYLEWKSEAE